MKENKVACKYIQIILDLVGSIKHTHTQSNPWKFSCVMQQIRKKS